MDKAIRYGFGGIGITVVFALLPFAGWNIPISVTYIGMGVGLIITAWAFWPLFGAVWLTGGGFWRIPLLDAARICHEKCEGFPVGKLVDRIMDTPHKKLSYFVASFTANAVPMFGEKPPSTVARQIPENETRGLISKEGTQDFLSLYDSKKVAYKNVFIKRLDLSRHLRYLRRLNADEQIEKWFG